VVCLICPARIVIGGGVTELGELLFQPLRAKVQQNAFVPFAGLTTIFPAKLGKAVVLHGAIALASQATS
jgi:glucokinase